MPGDLNSSAVRGPGPPGKDWVGEQVRVNLSGMTATDLLGFFDTHRERGEPLALVTVIDTAGSTYSKRGAQMLVNAHGVYRGMLSGGCLEGDLAVRAQTVIESCQPQTVTYDLAADDELWGLGVGCDGRLRVLLQALGPADGYAPFAAIADVLRGTEPARISLDVQGETQETVTLTVMPPPAVLVLGAGLDAEPVVRIAAELGWRCTVVDHRPAYIESGRFDAAAAVHCFAADELSTRLDLDAFSMAIIMSHHLASDRSYLRQLAATELRYIGLLGPAGRRQRLLDELGAAAEQLRGRVHGPAGLDLGGRGPGPIALSIVAQMQQVYAGA